MTESTLIVYEKGFQPAVDDAVATIGERRRLRRLHRRPGSPCPRRTRAEPRTETLSVDPHFWLDPTRYADVVAAIGDRARGQGPRQRRGLHGQRRRHGRRADRPRRRSSRPAWPTAPTPTIVTGHAAFGYLAAALRPHPGQRQRHLPRHRADRRADERRSSRSSSASTSSTVYAETLVSPALVETIARETGATVAVLDPVAGITEESAGQDYLAVMRANLATLEKGQQCS